jgi:hypothetical protein
MSENVRRGILENGGSQTGHGGCQAGDTRACYLMPGTAADGSSWHVMKVSLSARRQGEQPFLARTVTASPPFARSARTNKRALRKGWGTLSMVRARKEHGKGGPPASEKKTLDSGNSGFRDTRTSPLDLAEPPKAKPGC